MIRGKLFVLALALVLAATIGPAPGASAEVSEVVKAASLKITPGKNYIGGQGLRWKGNIGVPGSRTITMQRHLGRDGDNWEDVEYFEGRTNPAGNFGFWYPAPAMRGVTYRVVSDARVTPGVVLMARQPDLTLWVTGDDPDDPEDIGSVVAGRRFGISVDTTPLLFRRSDTVGLKPIPGRRLTLQQRVKGKAAEWVTLDRTKADRVGMGYFTGVTVGEPGRVVYRVRAEDWTKAHNEIGWFPSFPTYVRVSAPGADSGPAMDSPVAPDTEDEDEADSDTDAFEPDGSGSTAGKYGWFPMYFDFAWERGESLTSPPWRGTNQEGTWSDYSNGGGRVSKDGGGLAFDSKRHNRIGAGDFGTTKATLRDNPLKFGRWETKMWVRAKESDAKDYRIRVELVPERAPNDACRTITVAEYTDHGTAVRFGVNAVDQQWTGSKTVGAVDDRVIDFAIEVTPDHITWFIDTEPVGTVATADAISGVPMTMRVSMVGDPQGEMNRTFVKSDWQRGFTLAKGEQVKSGAPLTKRALGEC